MGLYAQETSVTVDKSKAEIERTLLKYGASSFMYGQEAGRAMVGFKIGTVTVKIILPLPDPRERRFTHTREQEFARTADNANKEWEQGCRSNWRALALIIKAKLEAIECGISSVEKEFLADVLLPGGKTVGQWMVPQLSQIGEGKQPKLLPLGD